MFKVMAKQYFITTGCLKKTGDKYIFQTVPFVFIDFMQWLAEVKVDVSWEYMKQTVTKLKIFWKSFYYLNFFIILTWRK